MVEMIEVVTWKLVGFQAVNWVRQALFECWLVLALEVV